MRAAMWRGKKTLRRWEDEKQKDGHLGRLRSMRPTSCDLDWAPPTLNHNKKLMQQEDKFTAIERENRCLLEKIATTMSKKEKDNDKDRKGHDRSRKEKDHDRDRMNRSLHAPFRRRQLETIDAENAKIFKRIQ